MPDPIQKHFGYGRYGQHAARIRLDHICQIWLPASDSVPFFKKGPDHTVQNQPRSNLDGLGRFWPSASGPEASRCARIIGPDSGRTQTACYQFPTFRLSCTIPQTAQIILCKTSLGPIWFWLTVSGFGQTDLAQKQVSVQESSGPLN